MLEFTDTSYIIGLWFVSWDDCNWMMCVYRDKPGAPWTIRYRFRYFSDKKVFDSDDERSWYGASAPATESEVALEQQMDKFASLIALLRCSTVERIIVHGSAHELKKQATGSRWFHSMKMADA